MFYHFHKNQQNLISKCYARGLCKREIPTRSDHGEITELDPDICVRSRRLSKIRCSPSGASIFAEHLNVLSLDTFVFSLQNRILCEPPKKFNSVLVWIDATYIKRKLV